MTHDAQHRHDDPLRVPGAVVRSFDPRLEVHLFSTGAQGVLARGAKASPATATRRSLAVYRRKVAANDRRLR